MSIGPQWTDSDLVIGTNLDSVGHGADSFFRDVVQAHLKGRHHHARLQLAPCGQQQSVGAETKLLLLATHLAWAEGLGGAQGVLGLETMLRVQAR